MVMILILPNDLGSGTIRSRDNQVRWAKWMPTASQEQGQAGRASLISRETGRLRIKLNQTPGIMSEPENQSRANTPRRLHNTICFMLHQSEGSPGSLAISSHTHSQQPKPHWLNTHAQLLATCQKYFLDHCRTIFCWYCSKPRTQGHGFRSNWKSSNHSSQCWPAASGISPSSYTASGFH